MSSNDRPRRKNGLSPPYTPAQLSTWIALPALVAQFFVCAAPALPIAAAIPCAAAVFITACVSVFFAVKTMSIDPSDPRLDSGEQDIREQSGDERKWDVNEPTKQCWICDHQVAEKSMHCKFCNKCVDHFDHHCMWLNTCVGSANYRFFYRTMLSISATLISHASPQIVILVDIYLGNWGSEERAEEWFQAGSPTPLVIVMSFFILFDLAALSLIGQLLQFHHRLQREGLTTYSFIVRENQRKREANRELEILESRREAAMIQAKEEGNGGYWWKLKIGGICRDSCGCDGWDPLQPDRSENDDNNDNGVNHRMNQSESSDGGSLHEHEHHQQQQQQQHHHIQEEGGDLELINNTRSD